MHPALSVSAWTIGLPDPIRPAMLIMATRPDQLDSAALNLETGSAALAEAVDRAHRAATGIAGAWSARPPAAALARIATAAGETALCYAQRAAAARTAAALVRQAQSDGAAAVALADSAAAGWAPLGPGLLVPDLPDRWRVISLLDRSLWQALGRLEQTATDLVAALAGDGPPPALSSPIGGPPAPTTADRTDTSNMTALAADLTSDDPSRREFADAVAGSIAHARSTGAPVQLLVYDPVALGGQGRVAISVGDVGRSESVAVLTPGIGNSPMAMNNTIDQAATLRGEALHQAPNDPAAVVVWFGYDIPLSAGADRPTGLSARIADSAAALGDANAQGGGDLLAADLNRIGAMTPASALVTLIGHSMGATTTSEAAAQHRFRADNLVLLGSPGAGADVPTAAAYQSVTPGHTYVVSHDSDIVTRSVTDLSAVAVAVASGTGFPVTYGPDPAAASFGAQRIAAPSNVPTPWYGAGSGPHALSNYLNGPSLIFVASVMTGRYSRVPIRKGR